MVRLYIILTSICSALLIHLRFTALKLGEAREGPNFTEITVKSLILRYNIMQNMFEEYKNLTCNAKIMQITYSYF